MNRNELIDGIMQVAESYKNDILYATGAMTDIGILVAEYAAQQSKWISINVDLPDFERLVWLSDGEGCIALGCRFKVEDGWVWANLNSIMWIEKGRITGDCEIEDLNVKFWHRLPELPIL